MLNIFNINQYKMTENSIQSQVFSDIKSIYFGFLSSSEIERLSVAEINCSKLLGPNTVYDERLGVTKNNEECVTCGKKILECLGHFGHINLSVPIVHPLFLTSVLQCLECFCEKCSSLLLTHQHIKLLGYNRYTGSNRFNKIHQYIKSKITECLKCKEIQCKYFISEGKIKKMIEKKEDSVVVKCEEILKIFSNISIEDLSICGLDKCYKPYDFIIEKFPVVPVCCRSFVVTNKGIHDDDLTSKYVEIIKINNRLSKEKDEKTRQDYISSLEFHIKTLMDNSNNKARQINGRPIKCIQKRLNGKGGQFRSNLLGKRCDQSGRTVIGPDVYIRADEMVLPYDTSTIITFPERVYSRNINKLQEIVNNKKANYIIRDGQKINLSVYFQPKITYKQSLFLKGDYIIRNNKKIDPFKYKEIRKEDIAVLSSDRILRNGKLMKIPLPEKYISTIEDRVLRNGKFINPNLHILKYGKFEYMFGDKIYRRGKELQITFQQKTSYELKIGDIVERHLQTGDYVFFNRQPSLHKGSMIAKKVVVLKEDPYINSGLKIKTFRFGLACCASWNSDFDGDEMNIQTPQSYQSKIELEQLSSTEALIKSGQNARLLLNLSQDSLTGGYLMTRGEYRLDENGINKFFDRVKIEKDLFFDIVSLIDEWDMDFIFNKLNHIEKVSKWWNKKYNNEKEFELFTGHNIFSMLLPNDFCYTYEPNKMIVIEGVMVSGFLSKAVLASGFLSLTHILEKEYGAKITVDFVSNYQFIINKYLITYGFSIGIKDCIPTVKANSLIKQELAKSFVEAQTIIETENDPIVREMRINACLNNATIVGQKISKESMSFDNSLNTMVVSGSKGNYVNISQIVGLLGQQNMDGQRIPKTGGRRTLSHYSSVETIPERDNTNINMLNNIFESRGFVSNSYLEGLSPQQFFFHAAGGREGLIDTSQKTATSGYVQRRIVKKMEDLKISYNRTVTNAVDNIIQFEYGNGLDPARVTNIKGNSTMCNIKNLADKLNNKYEYNKYNICEN